MQFYYTVDDRFFELRKFRLVGYLRLKKMHPQGFHKANAFSQPIFWTNSHPKDGFLGLNRLF